MEDRSADARKVCLGKEDTLHCLSSSGPFMGDHSSDYTEAKSKRLVRRVNSQRTLILNIKQLQRSKSSVKYSFLQTIRVLDSWIPKPMVTLDEKYLRHCFEVIHIGALKAASCDVSLNLDWGSMNILSDVLNPAKIENTRNLARLDFDCPSAAVSENVGISPAEQWIVGSIMGSKSMVNILNSPLLCQNGTYDGDINLGKVSLADVEGSLSYDFVSSPDDLSNHLSHKHDKEAVVQGDEYNYGSETSHERVTSLSSTNSSCSDQSSLSAAVTQGMLQCTWNGENPHFVFSLDDQKLVYEANLWKVDSADDNSLDYIYLIHSRTRGPRDSHYMDSQLVGKMKVSTAFTLCPDNSRVMVREFVLFGGNGNFVGGMQSLSHEAKKNKRLSKKVSELFRTSYSMKKRTFSRFGGSSSILDSCPWEPLQDTDNNIDACGSINLLENDLPPNIELAAIVVKEHLPDNRPVKAGGWGLKFLKKVGLKQTDKTDESLLPAACSDRGTGDCSTSMDVLLPAGLHGGPRTRKNGPSSLIERWKSGGCCDCGGWDLGCPLTVLNRYSPNKELLCQADMPGECNLIDLVLQGSENGAPPLRMVNVYDGLYFVHFQSTLSALQSFSIAMAFIHNQSPTLRPRNVQELK